MKVLLLLLCVVACCVLSSPTEVRAQSVAFYTCGDSCTFTTTWTLFTRPGRALISEIEVINDAGSGDLLWGINDDTTVTRRFVVKPNETDNQPRAGSGLKTARFWVRASTGTVAGRVRYK